LCGARKMWLECESHLESPIREKLAKLLELAKFLRWVTREGEENEVSGGEQPRDLRRGRRGRRGRGGLGWVVTKHAATANAFIAMSQQRAAKHGPARHSLA